MKAGDCPLEVNTGLVYDDRYKEFQSWKTSEGNIMRENGVYERLYGIEPQDNYLNMMTSSNNLDFVIRSTQRMTRRAFSWDDIRGSEPSEMTRNLNGQSLWARSTIPWSLHCD